VNNPVDELANYKFCQPQMSYVQYVIAVANSELFSEILYLRPNDCLNARDFVSYFRIPDQCVAQKQFSTLLSSFRQF